MLNFLTTIRGYLSGCRTYITAVGGILVALAAWSSRELTGVELATALFVAMQMIFIRAGISSMARKVSDDANQGAYDGARDAAEE